MNKPCATCDAGWASATRGGGPAVARAGGIRGAYECIRQISETDFTEDLRKMRIPTLVVHGDDDQIVPIGASANAAASDRHVRNVLASAAQQLLADPSGDPAL